MRRALVGKTCGLQFSDCQTGAAAPPRGRRSAAAARRGPRVCGRSCARSLVSPQRCRRLGAPLGPQRGQGAGGIWGRSPPHQRAAKDRTQRDTGQSGRGRSRGEARAARARPRPPDRSAPKPPGRPKRRPDQRARATGGDPRRRPGPQAGPPAKRTGRAAAEREQTAQRDGPTGGGSSFARVGLSFYLILGHYSVSRGARE